MIEDMIEDMIQDMIEDMTLNSWTQQFYNHILLNKWSDKCLVKIHLIIAISSSSYFRVFWFSLYVHELIVLKCTLYKLHSTEHT